jgi:hypothetical protein
MSENAAIEPYPQLDPDAEFYCVAYQSAECPVCESWDVVSFHTPSDDHFYAANCRACGIEWADWNERKWQTWKYMPTDDKTRMLTDDKTRAWKVGEIQMSFTVDAALQAEIDAEKGK